MKSGTRPFWIETGETCRDCGIRNVLTIDGLPRRHRYYGFRLSGGCAGCGGTGRASVQVVGLPGILESLSKRRIRPLTQKQKFVLELRYGLRDGASYSQREIAEMMGVSQQTVDRFEKAGRAKIESLFLGSKKAKTQV